MQAESSLSRQASESGGAESEPATPSQGETSTSAGQEAADVPPAEQVGVKLAHWGSTGQHRTYRTHHPHGFTCFSLLTTNITLLATILQACCVPMA